MEKNELNNILKSRFPGIDVNSTNPWLRSVNGFGCTFFGGRDHDIETGTYVKTHYITLLFIPLIPIGAYRVIDGKGGGWIVLGKVPLSGTDISPFRMLSGVLYGAFMLAFLIGLLIGVRYCVNSVFH